MEIKDLKAAMLARHSVRSYLDKPIPQEIIDALRDAVQECNTASGLHIQLVVDEPQAFGGFMAHYGKFSGVKNYFALVGPKSSVLDERLGYYGAQLTLLAQHLGLNTCWVGLSYSKGKCPVDIAPGEKLSAVIALGYGATQGVAHKGKSYTDVTSVPFEQAPQWFRDGVEAALLAPTAMNQQKFRFGLTPEGKVTLKSGVGFYAHMDLGIARRFFEIGAAPQVVCWE